MPEAKDPPPIPPGRVFVLYKKPGSKKFSAHIAMPGGIDEVFDTDSPERASANGLANGRVRQLQKEHGIESAAAYKKRTGSALSSSAIRVALAQGKVPDESAARTRKLIPDDDELGGVEDGAPSAPREDWERTIVRIEAKFALGFQRIVAMMLMGQDRDPNTFLEHVRAIVAEVTLSALTPSGRLQKKRGRPPGS